MREMPEASDRGEVTLLLDAICEGRREAAADLLPLVYHELRRLAGARLAALPPGQTLEPTALVHDAYLRLVENQDPRWDGRAHFFGAAAQAMRHILVEQARRKARVKHGGDRGRCELHDDIPTPSIDQPDAEQVLAVDASMNRLRAEHPRHAEVVMLRYFAGLTEAQIAELLGVSTRTVERDWRFARAWLHCALTARSERDEDDDCSKSTT